MTVAPTPGGPTDPDTHDSPPTDPDDVPEFPNPEKPGSDPSTDPDVPTPTTVPGEPQPGEEAG